MAPTLRCPDCGHRHPLAPHAAEASFRCEQCGRALKVPEQYRRAPEVAPAPEPQPQRVGGGRVEATPMPAVSPGATMLPPISTRATPVEAELGPLPVGWRIAIWIVGVPLGAIVGGVVANAIGILTMSQLEDVFLESGARRFAALVRFVPAWGIATACIVHGTITLLEARRRRQLTRRATAASAARSPVAAPAAAEPAADDDGGEPTAALPVDPAQAGSRPRAS